MAEEEKAVASVATESEDPFFSGSTLADLEKEVRDAEENPGKKSGEAPKVEISKEETPKEEAPKKDAPSEEAPAGEDPKKGESKAGDGEGTDKGTAEGLENLEDDQEAAGQMSEALKALEKQNENLRSKIGREAQRRGEAEKKLSSLESTQAELVKLFENNPEKLKKIQDVVAELTGTPAKSERKKDAEETVEDIAALTEDGLEELAGLEDTKPLVKAIRGIKKAFGSKLDEALKANEALQAKVDALEKSDSSRKSVRVAEEIMEKKWEVLN